MPDEGVGFGGEFGPYRQSERKPMYKKYADYLIENGFAYYAFDTAEELDELRNQAEAKKEVVQQRDELLALVKMVMDTNINLGTGWSMRADDAIVKAVQS